MPSLSDKLKALGVQQGAQNIQPADKPAHVDRAGEFSIENVMPGRWQDTPLGETFVVETFYPTDFQHGRFPVLPGAPLERLARWANEQRLFACPPTGFTFLDTETTGLAGGTSTYPFLVGLARFDEQGFHLAQYFMRDPAEESAQLAAVEQFMPSGAALVTFNGKTYDIPLLNTRFTLKGWTGPFKDAAHIDLLHLARRLWRDRLPSRSLGSLEAHILGTTRTGEDIPGWMIPNLYFQYLRDRDARPLANIFYHNAMDILAMASLLNCMNGLIARPLDAGDIPPQDRLALARLVQDLGDLPEAIQIYETCAACETGGSSETDDAQIQSVALEARLRLAGIFKQQENFTAAIPLWEQAAASGSLEAHVELAKFSEHRQRDFRQASAWTIAAIRLVGGAGYSPFDRQALLPELHHRLERLENKSSHISSHSNTESL